MNRLKALSRSSQFLLGAGLLLFIFLFFDWQQACAGPFCAGRSGWSGWGVPAGLFVIALVLWEVAQIFGLKLEQLPLTPVLLSVVLAAVVVLFTVIKFLVNNEARHWPAWIGLILGIAIGVGALLRLVEGAPKATREPPTAA